MGKRKMDSELHRIKLETGTVYQTSKGGNYYFRFQVKGERKCVSLKTTICIIHRISFEETLFTPCYKGSLLSQTTCFAYGRAAGLKRLLFTLLGICDRFLA